MTLHTCGPFRLRQLAREACLVQKDTCHDPSAAPGISSSALQLCFGIDSEAHFLNGLLGAWLTRSGSLARLEMLLGSREHPEQASHGVSLAAWLQNRALLLRRRHATVLGKPQL